MKNIKKANNKDSLIFFKYPPQTFLIPSRLLYNALSFNSYFESKFSACEFVAEPYIHMETH